VGWRVGGWRGVCPGLIRGDRLETCFALLTGQCLPILIVSGKVCLQVPILPTFTQVDAMLCNWSC
jgi:hypothetical protein